MQVNIGQKIKDLRKRDGRKQEDLAKALGVTSQAVSRWEANGCYPDMGMIPAIANYFHITIDELFGYNNDRNNKINEYRDKANYMLNSDKDMTECIAWLRKGLNEFPAETVLKCQLAAALNRQGWKVKGEKPNKYWEEAALLYEELLADDKSCIVPLLSIYAELEEYEKAEKLAGEQPGVDISKEVLLGRIYGAENAKQYEGEAVITLLHELRFAIDVVIANNDELLHSQEGLDILLSLRQLYEKIFGEKCHYFHSDFCFIDIVCVKIAGNIGDYDAALSYFDSAVEQYMKFKQCRTFDSKEELPESKHFETTFLREIHPSHYKVYVCEAEFLEYAIQAFPDNVKEQIRRNPKYACIFTESK